MPWGLDRIDGVDDDSFDDGDLTGAGVRVYIVDDGVQGSHVDFGGRVVSGHTVGPMSHAHTCPCRFADDLYCALNHSPLLPSPLRRDPQHASTQHRSHRTQHPFFTPQRPLSHDLFSQARVHAACASCQAVNGILPADGTGCGGHGTHVASTVGGLVHGVAKEVTIVPAFTCFKFRCRDGRYECGSGSDIAANLECA